MTTEFYERTRVSADVWREMRPMITTRLEQALRRRAAHHGHVLATDPRVHAVPEPVDGEPVAYVVFASADGRFDPDAAAKIWPPRCAVVTGDGSLEAPYEVAAPEGPAHERRPGMLVRAVRRAARAVARLAVTLGVDRR